MIVPRLLRQSAGLSSVKDVPSKVKGPFGLKSTNLGLEDVVPVSEIEPLTVILRLGELDVHPVRLLKALETLATLPASGWCPSGNT